MNSHDRVKQALDHQEPARIPFDLGGTGLTTMHITAYQNLRRHLGLPPIKRARGRYGRATGVRG